MSKPKKSPRVAPVPPTLAGAGLLRRVEAIVIAPPFGEFWERADRYIAETLGLLSRSQIKARSAHIEVEGRPAKLSRPLRVGEHLVVTWLEEPSPGLVPEALALSILYEDSRVLVIDKAQGMVSHPGAGNRRGTLANAVLGYLLPSNLPQGSAPIRGGIVHRLDKDTSGVIIVAKDAEAQALLAAQFKERTSRKEYLAITRGLPRGDSGRIENRLGRDRRDRKRFTEVAEGGRTAITDWRLAASFGNYALLRLRPRTGRTHQLRVHMAELGIPILGDPIYGGPVHRAGSNDPVTLKLHAWKLSIILPGAVEPRLFEAPPPPAFLELLRDLEVRYGKKMPRRE